MVCRSHCGSLCLSSECVVALSARKAGTDVCFYHCQLDTVRRRMMMTSGTGVYYKNFIVAMKTIVQQEGPRSLMRGALANILRGVSSAGILSLYDQAQMHFHNIET